MNEKYKEYKKTRQYKMHLFMNVILFILFIIIVFSAYIFYIQFNTNEEYDPNYSFEIIDNRVILFNSGIRLNEYECYNTCNVHTENGQYFFFNGRILLQDGDIFYLYDLVNNEKLSADFQGIDFILDNHNNIRLFVISHDGYYGIMNLNGHRQVDLIYNGLGNRDENGYLMNYSYESNYITALRGDLWGKISLDNGRGLIDFQYEDIRISNYNRLAVKEDGLWYLVDRANIRIIGTGYQAMDIYQDYLVVMLDDEAFVIDLDGEPISNKIMVHLPVNPWLFRRPNNGLYTTINDGRLYLYIGHRFGEEYRQTRFVFNEEANEIVIQP